MRQGQHISDEICQIREQARTTIFLLAEKFYVEQLMTIEEVVKTLRTQGHSIVLWRLLRWLKERGSMRTNEQTILARRKAGIIHATCSIPGCERPAQGCRKYCKTCIPDGTAHRAWLYYGVTQPRIDELLARQNGVCAGCKRVMIRGRKGSNQHNTMCIDHNHVTKEIRGLLCLSCNRALGYAQEQEDILRSLATYLEVSRTPDTPASP